MLSLLAEIAANPSAGEIKSWLEVLAWLSGIAVAIAAAWRLVTRPRTQLEQPIEVRAHAGVVTKQMYDETHGRIGRERREVDAEIKRVEETAERRTEKLEDKIDENTKLTAQMSGQLNQMNQSMHALSTSVTQFIQNQVNR